MFRNSTGNAKHEGSSLEENIAIAIQALITARDSYKYMDKRTISGVKKAGKNLQALLKCSQAALVRREQLTRKMQTLEHALEQFGQAARIMPLSLARAMPLPGGSVRPHPSVNLHAIPAPELWDAAWTDRLQSLRPVDFALLHKQHMEHIQPLLQQASKCHNNMYVHLAL